MGLFERLKSRPDSEHQQALARIVIACVGFGYTIFIYTEKQQSTVLYNAWFLLGFIALSLTILVLIIVHPRVSSVRRYAGMIADLSGTAIVMYLLGEPAKIFIFIYLWIIIGNGLRYGQHYLYVAMVLGLVSYLIMLLNTAYWQQDVYLAIGYLGCMIILPLFFSSLLKKLNTTNAELAKLAEQLRKLATHDSLTGLPNRFLFTESLDHELSLAQRHQEKLAVMFIDLDGFKEINDTHGHQSGDIVLKTVASRLLTHVRKSDLVARLAGDEFVVLLTDVNCETAKHVAHKLIHDIRTAILVADCSVVVTASIGIAVYPDSGSTANDIMAKADMAMYRCKQQGKNRMMCDGDPEPVLADVTGPSGNASVKNDKTADIVRIRPPHS